MTEPFAEQQSITVALPVADRRTTFAFYADGLGLRPVGDPAEDGVPEPLQFALNDGVRVMFIPTGGFGWVTGNRATAPSDQSECLLVMTLADQRDVDSMVDRARGAGAEIMMEPAEQPWGFSAVFADPDGHLWQVRSAHSEGPFADSKRGGAVDDEVALVMERELALLTPEVRGSADQLEELLDPDFGEIGKSGRLWTRGEMITELVTDTDPEQHPINFSDLSGRTVGRGFVLLTYVTEVEGRRARRSSLWRQSTQGWRVLHHQGTPIP